MNREGYNRRHAIPLLSGASTWIPTMWPVWQSRMAPVVAHPMFPSSTHPLSRCSSCCGAQRREGRALLRG